MSANGGDIVVQLRMDDGQFRVAVVEAGDLVRALKGKIDQTASSVQNLEKHSQSMGRRFRDLVLTLGNLRFVAMDINDVFLRLPMSILKTAGELEKMQQLMTGLSKETELAKRRLEGMSDMKFVIGMAKNAPFEIQALSDSFVKLKTAGIDPTNGSMQSLVDSVARFGGSGEMLKRASVAIQQMAGKGVISMEELRQQLGEAVPTAMKAMAEGMEVSMAELAKIVSSGTLQAGPALQKMFLRMQIDNAGAAAEMMNTWVGMTSQLKTEWDLTAQYIAQNGFMEASKEAVQELVQMLRSPEFQEFGAAFGQMLGGSVTTLTDAATIIVRYREEIGLLIKAWLGYKIVSGIIAPISRALEDGTKGHIKSLRDEVNTLTANAAIKQQIKRSEVNEAMWAAESNSRALATKLSNDQKELASVRARNAAILAEDARLRSKLQAMRTAERTGNVNNYGQQQATLRALDELSKKNSELLKRERELQQSIPLTGAAMSASTSAARAKARELAALSRNMGLARASTIAATAAVGSFNAVVSFLGGPVGVAITAIMGLVYWWNKTRDAAIEAAEAQDRAANRTSQKKDIETLTEGAKKAAKDLEEARKRLATDTTVDASATSTSRKVVTRIKTEAERAADQAAFMKALAADRQAYELLERAKTTVAEQGAEQRAANRMLDLDRELRDLDLGTKQKIAKIKADKDAYIKANGENSKSAVAEIAKFNREQAKVLEQGLQEQLERARQAERNAAASVNAAGITRDDRLARQLEASKAGERVADLENRLKGVRDALSAKPEYKEKGDKDKAAKESPLQKMIEQMAEERARLEAELAGLEGTTAKADKVAGIVANMRQRINNGDFGAGLTREEQSRLINDAVTNANLEKRKDDLEKQIKDMQRVTDFIEGMRPDVEAAMELLADPMGTSQRGALEKRADKFIGSNLQEIENAALKMGKTAEQIKAQMRGDAQRGDTFNFFGKLVQETEQTNRALVDDTRQAARARAEAENERHAQVIENLIQERALSGNFTYGELMKMREIAENSATSRAAKLAQDFKNPVEKMAENWRNATDNMKEASVGWANKSMDALTELVTTGKTDFKSLANSIITDIIRINMQKAASGAISGAMNWAASLFTFADGGIMTEFGSMPLKKYASGGIANSPQLALYGEGSLPEAYVPLPDGRTIPVTLKGMAGGGGNNVEINITVHKDGSSSSQSSDNANSYKQMAERIKGVVREELMRESRPGGMLYK